MTEAGTMNVSSPTKGNEQARPPAFVAAPRWKMFNGLDMGEASREQGFRMNGSR